jgi:signal transduction histidine kinase
MIFNWLVKPKFLFLCKALACLCSLGLLVWASLLIIPPFCRLTSPNCPDTILDAIPIIVAFGFWAVELIVFLSGQPLLVVVFFSLSSISLAIGLVSGLNNNLARTLFYICLAWLSPVMLHFNLVWSGHKLKQIEKFILVTSYVLGLTWSIPFLILPIPHLNNLGIMGSLRSGIRLTLVLIFLLVIGFLIYALLTTSKASIRFQIRLIFIVTLLALMPLILLSLLPQLLGLNFIVSDITFPWLLLIPLAYCFTILREKLAWMEKFFSQYFGYFFSLILFTSIYLTTSQFLSIAIPDWSKYWASITAALGAVLFFLLTRTHQIFFNLVNWSLYGNNHYSLASLSEMTNSLASILSREEFHTLVVDRIVSIFHVERSALFLKSSQEEYRLVGVTGFEWAEFQSFSLPQRGKLATFLSQASSMIKEEEVRKKFTQADLLPEEWQALNLSGVNEWIPLLSQNEMHGFLLIGFIAGDEFLSDVDRHMWFVFSHQVGIAAKNMLLVESLQASQDEVTRIHQQLLFTREQERREIARDLHDNVIQELLGVSYQIAAVKQKVSHNSLNQADLELWLDLTRQRILSLNDQIRSMIHTLRPVGLKEFGLGVSLENYIRQIQQAKAYQAVPLIDLHYDPKIQFLPESIAICLFRVVLEALRNAIKHAHAAYIGIDLSITTQEVTLKIEDNGHGFALPTRLNDLAYSNHYGLIGMIEQVNLIDGQWNIKSTPNQGTQIEVRVPLKSTFFL